MQVYYSIKDKNMTYSEALKSGFSLINHRWQLIVVQVGTMMINCMGFFIMVGIPLGIAFIIFGLDLTSIADAKDIFSIFRHPAELFSKYFGLILLVVTSFLIYLLVAATFGLYVFGGSIGTIGMTLLEPDTKFSMSGFFKEAKKIFFPLMWFSFAAGMIFLILAFILGLFGGGIAAIVSAAKTQDSTLALFLGIFLTLILILIGLSIIFGVLSVTVYGFAILFFKGEGSLKTLKKALGFIWNNQKAFLLYVFLFAGYFFVSFMMMLLVYPFKLIPIVGAILSFPVQILSYIVQSYLGLVVIASVFSYYFNSEVKKPEPSPEALSEANISDSTIAEDISGPQAPVQGQAPPEKDGSEQTGY